MARQLDCAPSRPRRRWGSPSRRSSITIAHIDGRMIAAFEHAVAELPNVVEAERLFGEPDYMLRVLVRDLAAYQELYDQVRGALPGVQRATSTMERVGAERAVPLD